MNVLIATDGSDSATYATTVARQVLHPSAEVVLAMVVAPFDDPMLDAGGFEGPLQSDEEATAEFERRVGKAEQELATEEAGAPVPVETRVVTDDNTAHGILKAADEVHADVIVIGASEKGALRRLFSGSLTDDVVHHATCPVLVVPLAADAPSG